MVSVLFRYISNFKYINVVEKQQIELQEIFLQAQFNKAIWDTFEEFKDFYVTYLRETRYAEISYVTEDGKVSEVFQPIIHFPTLKTYEIWSEGTMLPNGTRLGHFFVGEETGRNFAEACHKKACRRYLNTVTTEKDMINKVSSAGVFDYDHEDISYLEMKWYWSKEIAEKTFG